MATDITRNLFYWFRGGLDAKDKATERAQLENNVTKGLVCVLEHCDRQAVLGAFLREIGLPSRQDVGFSLQRRPSVADTVTKRVLVAITGGEAEVAQRRRSTRAGRPDAWIFSGRWAALVESKIGRKLSRGQLQAHAKAAGWAPGSYRLVFLTWQDVHALCKAAASRVPKKDGMTRLLLADWLAYLEHQNMTEFEKLDEIDFDFLGLPAEERRAVLSHVRSRMYRFAELLAKRPAAKQTARLYKNRKVTAWKYSDPNTYGPSYWFNVGGDPSPRAWHATVFYRPAGLSLELLNSQNHLVRKLCRRGIDAFRQVVEMAARHDDIYVGCRRGWYRDPDSSYKGQHISHADQPIMVLPSTLDRQSRESYAVMLRNALKNMLTDKRSRTELNLPLRIPRGELLGKPVGRQVTTVARGLKRLYPILAYLLDQG